MNLLRQFARFLRYTPLHPQWLLGRRRAPRGIGDVTGLIIDIGAADQWIARHLSKATNYVPIDYPPTANVFYNCRPMIYADACHLPLTSSCADGVICLEVIEHVPDPAQAALEIARILKPGGQAWISMPFLYPLHNEPFDFQRYTEYGLQRDVARAGLDLIELRRSKSAIITAGVLLCLAVAGGLDSRGAVARTTLLPAAVPIILFTNITIWLLSLVWPDWRNMSASHHLLVQKPTQAT